MSSSELVMSVESVRKERSKAVESGEYEQGRRDGNKIHEGTTDVKNNF